MRLATRADKETVVNILKLAFNEYRQTHWALKAEENPKRLEYLFRYTFDENIEIGKIYLNAENSAVAIWNTNKKSPFNFRLLIAKFKLIFRMGLPVIFRLIELERLLYLKFPKKSDYDHLHMLGVIPTEQGKGHAKQLLLPILDKMATEGRPVYLETGAKKNVNIYNKLGFSVIHIQKYGDYDLHIMRKAPTQVPAELTK